MVAKRFRMESMNALILERLLRFLDLTEEDNPTQVHDKINQTRVEVVGQKPTKMKKAAADEKRHY